MLLHTSFGRYCGGEITDFLAKQAIRNQIDVIGSHGHTTFHQPQDRMTHQLGDGASIVAVTGIPVVSDLRALDIALGGQGAPIVPIGEKLLFEDYHYFLNIGGISNVSIHNSKGIIAFDVCPANRVLNMLSMQVGKQFDEDGVMASAGKIDNGLLTRLNALDYYHKSFPKSLPNSFGVEVVYPMISGPEIKDALATYCEHIAVQIALAMQQSKAAGGKMLITGGGAFNKYLVSRIQKHLSPLEIEVVVPPADTVEYKEALIMALIAILKIRGDANVLSSVTGAGKDSCNGALWS